MVAVYDRDEAGWVVDYLRKAQQRGQQSPLHPPGPPAPQQPQSRGGAAAHGHRPEAPPQPPTGSVTHYHCTQCGERKLKMDFSKNMQRGNKSVIRCKLCVSGAQAGPVAQQRVLEAAGQATMECTKCFEWKPVSCFSSNNQSGSTRKCKECAAAAASACEFTCKYCGNDYADAPNPMSFFVKKGGFREPPFGPVCNMPDCRAEYNRRKSAAPDMEAKNARLQKEKETDAAQAKAEKERLEARLASAQQENDAFREAADSGTKF